MKNLVSSLVLMGLMLQVVSEASAQTKEIAAVAQSDRGDHQQTHS